MTHASATANLISQIPSLLYYIRILRNDCKPNSDMYENLTYLINNVERAQREYMEAMR